MAARSADHPGETAAGTPGNDNPVHISSCKPSIPDIPYRVQVRRYREALIKAGATAAGTASRSGSRIMGAAEMEQLAERMAAACYRSSGKEDPVSYLSRLGLLASC